MNIKQFIRNIFYPPARMRTWGIVKGRSGKWFPKNYGHVLKNGKGLTRSEALVRKGGK